MRLARRHWRPSCHRFSFLVSGGKSARTVITPFARIGSSYTAERADGTQIIPDVQFGYRHSEAARGMPITLVAQNDTAFAGNRIDLPRVRLTF